MDLSTITVADFKSFFARDFAYLKGSSSSLNAADFVSDNDIQRAFDEAQISFNLALWSDDPSTKIGYLYLSAHLLLTNLKASSGAGGSPFLLSSRSVGSVSESYAIPQAYKDNPQFSWLISTPYGLKYLNLLLPSLIGNIGVVIGRTQP